MNDYIYKLIFLGVMFGLVYYFGYVFLIGFIIGMFVMGYIFNTQRDRIDNLTQSVMYGLKAIKRK